MIKKLFYFRSKLIVFIALLLFAQAHAAYSQQCSYTEASIKIDFGTNNNPKDINLSALKSYKKISDKCPNDGEYSFTNYTFDCFDGKWHTLTQDHTSADASGRFMLVNASENPSAFFINYIGGLIPQKKYKISFWVCNICKSADGCTPTPPVIKTTLLNENKEIVHFTTALIAQTYQATWREFYGEFTMPIDASTIILKMEDITDGGCGNDFAIDDIEFIECKIAEKDIVVTTTEVKTPIPEKPVIVKPIPEKPVIVKPIPVKPVIVKPVIVKPVILKPVIVKPVIVKPVIVKPVIVKPVIVKAVIIKPIPVKPVIIKQQAITKSLPKVAVSNKESTVVNEKEKPLPIPKVIANRENTLAKKIVTEEAEILIELYDNGEIDGDTITVYHNNKLIVNHTGLSLNPITMKIKVDKANPHHEIVMIADNLGSIPPNTSLMIVTANKKRYEIFISSSDQKNAKIIIDLVE